MTQQRSYRSESQENTLTIDRLSFQLDVLGSYLALKRRRAELEEAGRFANRS
jgi:hypothetical protein